MKRYNVPRLAFINKLDRQGSNPWKVIGDLRNQLKLNAAAVQLPLGLEEKHSGVLDLIELKCYTFEGDKGETIIESGDIPSNMMELVHEKRMELLERLADVDEEIGELFLMEEEPTPQQFKDAIRRRTVSCQFVPVFMGSAFKNKGVQYLLDAVVDYLPSPLDIPAAIGMDPENEETRIEVETTDHGKFVALAFKLWADKFVGKLVFFRVYSGVVRKGDTVYNPRTRRSERVGRLIQIQANEHKDIDACYAGDIAAMVGLKNVTTGDTLAALNHDVVLEPPTFPEPVISMAVEPKTKADQEKLALALGRLSEEDPTFNVKTDEETGQTIISGMGELHLEIIIDRLRREFKVDANTGAPQIAYRETITTAAGGEGKLVKQSGGRGQYGHVILSMKPNEKGKGLTIENKVIGGTIPKEYINAVYKGVNEAMSNGIIAGYPVVDVHVEILDGSYHDVDSNENAFTMAAIFAMKDGFKKAKSILLEPIMAVEVSTPDDYQGDVMGDLNRRRGQIQTMESKGKLAIVRANVPLKEMFGYSTAVRTLSSGRASYAMTPSHFEQVPSNIVEEIVSDRLG